MGLRVENRKDRNNLRDVQQKVKKGAEGNYSIRRMDRSD